VPSFQRLPQHHTFRDALVTLIEAVKDECLTRAKAGLNVYYNLSIDISGPFAAAQIEIDLSGFDDDGNAIFNYREVLDYFDPSAAHPDSDLKVSRSFSTRTIARMASLLKKGDA
jgi:hypothetical protein